MINLIKTLLLIFFLGLVGCSSSSTPILRDNQGHEIKISQLKGKWVIINYWATWCHPCRKEISELNRFYHNHLKKIVLLSKNYDKLRGKKLLRAIDSMNIKFPTLVTDPVKIFHLQRVTVVPTTFIFNPEGRLVKRFHGPITIKQLNQFIDIR